MVLSSLVGGVLTSQECVRGQREFEAQSTKCDDRTPPPDVAAAAKAHHLSGRLKMGWKERGGPRPKVEIGHRTLSDKLDGEEKKKGHSRNRTCRCP